MARAKNLSEHSVAQIISILDGWTGKLTWELLIEKIDQVLNARYTRQALDKHIPIKTAFLSQKAQAVGRREEEVSDATAPEVRVLLQQIQRLEATTARLERENNNLLEQFVVWAHNADSRGITPEILSRPMPSVDRERTAN